MNYSRSDILSLRLRAATDLRKLTRRELFSRLQLMPALEPIMTSAYNVGLRKIWREKMSDSPHGQPWFVSHHASQYPGNNPKACGRKAMYQMMDIPNPEPPSRRLHLTAQSGKAIEVDLVTMLDLSGVLISAAPDEPVQTLFEIPDYRLTGSVDSAILIKERVVPVEIKTKWEGVIDEMRSGKKGPDDSHVSQIKTQMGLIRAAQESGEIWSEYKECTYGYIYYLPRDTKYNPASPIPTAEFYVEYDPAFFETGLEILNQWNEYWDEGVLPSVNATKRHPFGWRWSFDPCKYCSYKKICKADHEAGIESLRDSCGIEFAAEINDDYDYESVRERVDERWPVLESS